MCGITGIIRLNDTRRSLGDDLAVVRAMNQRLIPRGPDDEGTHQQGAVTLGNRRLAIQDLTTAGHMPMQSASGRYVVTFNGEIYNHRELAAELGLADADLRSRSDTEVLLHAWERWGEDALDHLVGQWAFAMLERDTGRLWLARDRFGEKPLFYHQNGEALTFASSIPALLAAPWVPRELDPDTLVEYLTIRYVVAPRTVLRDVAKLPPGHLLRLDRDGVTTRCWYAPEFRRPAGRRRRSADLIEEFDTLFRRASSRCLVSDVPVALFLSDGIDSNGIHHALAQDGHQIPAYTFAPVEGEGSPSLGEVNETGAVEVRVPAGHRVEQMVPAFASLTEPVGDGAALAVWLLVRGAREQATVFLCGHGGDEVLGGYRLSYDGFRLRLFKALSLLPAPWLRDQTERYVHGSEPFAERWRRIRSRSAERTPDAVRYLIHKPLPVRDLDELHGGAGWPPPYLATVDHLYTASQGAHALDRMQEVLLHTFLSANLVSWADGVAMDASAELRMPFLDRDLAAFALGLEPRERTLFWPGRTLTKLILRRWGKGRLDESVLRRGKSGFPFGNLSQLLVSDGDVLRSRLLDATALRRTLPGLETWLAHPPEYFQEPWEGTLWALIALGIWCEHHGVV